MENLLLRSNMKKIAMLFICLLLLFGVSSCNYQKSDQQERDVTYNQMEIISVLISQVVFENERSVGHIQTEKAIMQIAEKKGIDVFRCETGTNFWLQINPNSAEWETDYVYSNRIAIYSPIPFRPRNSIVCKFDEFKLRVGFGIPC